MTKSTKAIIATTAFIGISLASLSLAQRNASQPATPANYATSNEWPTYGHDSGGMRFSPLAQITPANVNNLRVAWVYHLKPEDYVAAAHGGRGGRGAGGEDGAPDATAPGRGGRGGGPAFVPSEGTPVIVGGIMYISSPYGRVVALDATTGKEVWVYKLPSGSPATRGVEYFAGDAQTPPQIVVTTSDSKLLTLDAKTGALNSRFGTDGLVTLDKSTSSPAIMYNNLIIVSGRVQENSGPGTPGDVNAYDVHDGKKIWTFHSIPRPNEENFGSWYGDSWQQRSGVNVWGFMSVDTQRGIVYMPFGAPSGDLFGGDRPGDNLYGTSIVAADAKTGRYLWHFQVVHHDVFDFDLESAPVLLDVKQGGRTIPAVAVFGKSSLLFLLDRVTGQSIYGVEERKVAVSDVPGEKMSPTQPFPKKPEPLARLNFTMADIATVTPELEAACRKLIADNNIDYGKGPYAPTTYNRPRVVFPSEIGGANWGGGSFNPNLGYLFINVNDLGQLNGNQDPATGPINTSTLAGTNLPGGRTGPYRGIGPSGRFKDNASNMMCQQPPWGELVAVNVNTGNIAWKVPLGITEGLPAEKQKTGRPNIGGSIATASGLVFIGATDDSRFRAFDAKTGKELWTVKLSGSGSAVPSTYQGKDGKQYVVVTSTGGGLAGAPLTSDEITVFALP
jgi:quinoprotein glucose dehydrogenase